MKKKVASPSLHFTIYEQVFPKTLTKADRRKIQILESAIQTYTTLGIEYVSYEDIARAAGISRPLVQHHFPDKKELFISVVKLIRAQFQELAVEGLSKQSEPVGQLKEYIRATFYWFEKWPAHAHVWLYFFYLCPLDPELKRLHTELTQVGKERIVAILKMGAASGVFSQGDFTTKAQHIQRVITGTLVELKTEQGSGSLEQVREDVVSLILQWVGAKPAKKTSLTKD